MSDPSSSEYFIWFSTGWKFDSSKSIRFLGHFYRSQPLSPTLARIVENSLPAVAAEYPMSRGMLLREAGPGVGGVDVTVSFRAQRPCRKFLFQPILVAGFQ
jgi:hypothetical protein